MTVCVCGGVPCDAAYASLFPLLLSSGEGSGDFTQRGPFQPTAVPRMLWHTFPGPMVDDVEEWQMKRTRRCRWNSIMTPS